jgi:hypothetical protein
MKDFRVKSKVLNFFLILTSLIGFLEWGLDNKQFLFQVEFEIIIKLFTNPSSVIHPLTLIPLIGQITLFITLFQKNPNKVMTFIGIFGITLLIGVMFVIGLISLNYNIIFSTIPFLSIAILTLRHHLKKF